MTVYQHICIYIYIHIKQTVYPCTTLVFLPSTDLIVGKMQQIIWSIDRLIFYDNLCKIASIFGNLMRKHINLKKLLANVYKGDSLFHNVLKCLRKCLSKTHYEVKPHVYLSIFLYIYCIFIFY